MKLALNEVEFPVRLRFDRPMTDEELKQGSGPVAGFELVMARIWG